MLTRLKVSGFKNLVDVDVRFGPFTCIAGANGVGKSNLFDAIRFMSALADKPLVDAALSVRDEGSRTSDLRSLFHRVGDRYADKISLEAEMIIPEDAYDDLSQRAQASTTFVRYAVELTYRRGGDLRSLGSLELTREELSHINLSEASKRLFPHSVTWRKSVIKGRKTTPLISTEGDAPQRVIKQHQDGGSSGRPISRLAANLPRTVLSVANAAESPTALVVRREMQSWQLLQLEPSALRRPDEFTAPSHLGLDGANLPATLFRLAKPQKSDERPDSNLVYSAIANRLSDLIDDVSRIWVDLDESRELLTLFVSDRNSTPYPARSLSDGTLRFLALSVLAADPEAQGTLCLEEPENGIHPERIPAMLELLHDIATDCREPIGRDNPLRQVIVNTHSPAVVAQIPDDSLLIAELREQVDGKRRFKHPVFSWLPDTWRSEKQPDVRPVSRGKLLSYLNPTVPYASANGVKDHYHRSPRVMDRDDLQMLLPFLAGVHE